MQLLFFEPVYKDYIWGGSKLKDYFNKNTPFEKTAESWEISSNKNGLTSIKNGVYSGKYINELFENINIRKDIFGNYCEDLKEFPLLIKFIDANDNLSVQVHPDNDYALKFENTSGKAEAWYIIDCNDNAQIICGFNDKIMQKDKAKILESDEIEKYLNYIKIQKGDVVYIPPNTVHALLKNTLVCEIQQNSDLTYRIYDWDRVDKDGNSRPLHIDKALSIVDYGNSFLINHCNNDNNMLENILKTEFFDIDKLCINDNEYISKTNSNTFIAINVIDGHGMINNISIKKGDSFIIPACFGDYKIAGNLVALMTYIDKK